MSDKTRVLFTISLLWITGVLAAGQFAKVSAGFPALRAFYPDQGASLGFLISAVSIIGVVFGLFAGVILPRFGYKRLLVWAAILGGVLSVAQTVMPVFPVMLALRAIEGASHLVIVVAAPTMIGQIAPLEWRNTAMTVWSTVFAVAYAGFAWLGVPLIETVGFPALLWVHGLGLLGCGISLWFVLPRISARGDRPQLRIADVIARHRTAYQSPYISASAFGWLFYATSFVALVTVLPDFLPEDRRTFVSGIMPLAALLMSLTVGISMLRFLPPVTVLMVGFASAVVAALALLVVRDITVVSIVMLSAMGLVQAGSFAAIPALNATAENQALANGALAQAGNTGNLIGTPLLLVLVDMFGFSGLVGFAAAAFGGGFAVHLWLSGRRQP
ncbi:MFS transporter [Celeribacter arenosi]|uniref:MFS transporter n=1 Tax=Celeribacter arenosi TaxID=792649 RepID=A0ABP7JVS1_9RHOB